MSALNNLFKCQSRIYMSDLNLVITGPANALAPLAPSSATPSSGTMLTSQAFPCFSSLDYREVSNISRTKSQHLKDSHTVLRLSLPNTLRPDVKSRMKM